MRRTMAVVTAVAGLAMFAGCGNGPERVVGQAGPAGGIGAGGTTPSAVVTSPSGSAGLGSSPSVGASASSRALNGPSKSTDADSDNGASSDGGTSTGNGTGGGKPVLGPDGFGKLELGMTVSAAKRTGLLTTDGTERATGCDAGHKLKAGGDADATVYFDGNKGLVAIFAYPGLATPEGIKLGSSAAAVGRAYPSSEAVEGRWYVAVPGGRAAHYNIVVSGGKVTVLILQLDSQGCYE